MACLDRITQSPLVMGGKPCIRGMRVTVDMIISQLRAGLSVDAILEAYPYLEPQDIVQARRHAAERAKDAGAT